MRLSYPIRPPRTFHSIDSGSSWLWRLDYLRSGSNSHADSKSMKRALSLIRINTSRPLLQHAFISSVGVRYGMGTDPKEA
jgi:hypothetical protein